MEIRSRFDHYNFNVMDLERSIRFYAEALGLKEVRRKVAEDKSFVLVYLGDGRTDFYFRTDMVKRSERAL